VRAELHRQQLLEETDAYLAELTEEVGHRASLSFATGTGPPTR
jgi:hypothetical protein